MSRRKPARAKDAKQKKHGGGPALCAFRFAGTLWLKLCSLWVLGKGSFADLLYNAGTQLLICRRIV